MKYIKYLCLLLLLLFSIMSVNSAINAKLGALPFALSNEASCQFEMLQSQIIGSFKNIAHIKGFFVMSLLGLIGFSQRRYLKTGIYIGLLAVVTELSQMWSPSRRCRLTDLIPDAMGFAMAVTVVAVFISMRKFLFKNREDS